MIDAAHRRIERLLTRLAAILAFLTAAGPAAFFAGYTYHAEVTGLRETLNIQAIALERFINAQPDFWEFNADRMRAGFEPYAVPGQAFRVLGRSGEVVFSGGPVGDWPILWRGRPLLAFGQPVGGIEAGVSWRGSAVVSVLLLMAGLGCAWLIWGPMRRLPLTALREAKDELDRHHEHLEEQVRDRTRDLIEARDAAEAAARASSAFLASMSHELRTPLNAVMGFSQILVADETLPAEARDMVMEIGRAGENMLGMVENLIDVADIASGRFQLVASRFPVRAVLADSLAAVAPMAAERSVRIDPPVCRCDVDAMAIETDYRRLRQVLTSLLSNGIKYNRPGGFVRLECERDAEGIVFAVIDNGQGIAQDKQARVFTAFDRLGAECGPILGAGVGLAISRRIAEAMGGRIDFVSSPDSGSAFRVHLPEKLLGNT